MSNTHGIELIINNTGVDLHMFDKAIGAAIRAGGVLPEELRDLITLIPVEGYPGRWRIEAV